MRAVELYRMGETLIGEAVARARTYIESSLATVAAEALKITGLDLLKLGIVDIVLNEPCGGNHWAPLQAAETLKAALLDLAASSAAFL